MRLRIPRAPLGAALPALALAFLLTGSLAPVPAPPAPPTLASVALPPQAAAVGQAGEHLLDLADKVGATRSASDALAAAGVLPAPAASAGVRSPDLASALSRLGPQATPADLGALDAATADALVPLVDAVADAGALVGQAFARLTPAERQAVLDHVLDESGETAGLEALVDPTPLHQAAQGLLAAAEGFLDAQATLPLPALPGSPLAPVPYTSVAGASCFSGGFSLVSPGGLVEVGFTGSNTYTTERVLIVDLGGDDCYLNYPASYGPGSLLALPVSAIVDVGGDDLYQTTTDHASPTAPGSTWSAGVGIGGVGLVVDRWGNDVYTATLSNVAPNCAYYGNGLGGPLGTWQRTFAQGVGILGVGGLVDLGGDDVYTADSTRNLPEPTCFTGHAYTYAQGTGARLGVGFLVDSTGNDEYHATASAQGNPASLAHAHGQGTAAARGIGALIDEEGNELYDAATTATLTPGFQEAAMAYTFAQATIYGTREPRGESVTIPDCRDLGINCDCPVRELCNIDCTIAQVLCDLVSTPIHPVLPKGTTVSANLCSSLNVSPNSVTQAGVPCDLQALAILVDVQGEDRYVASSSSSGGTPPLDCIRAVWAGTAAQGSAPAKGAALLADAALDTLNTFSASSNADAKGCLLMWDFPTLTTVGVRASTSAQGFGGAFLWDFYDPPPFDTLLVTDLSAGILARAGVCGRDNLDFSGGITLNLNPDDPCDAPWARDLYAASSNANNPAPSGIAWAQTRAHGSGNGDLGTAPNPTVPGGPYQALGVGGHLDLFGDDRYSATARAWAPAGRSEPLVVAQGAAQTAVGVLLNVGDVDNYYAMAYLPAGIFPGFAALPVPQATQWSLPYVIAQADATVPAPVILVTVGIAFAGVNEAVAVLVDLFGGTSDTYSLAPYCPNNSAGILSGPYVWGNQVLLTALDPTLYPTYPCTVAANWNNNAPGSPFPGSAGAIVGVDW